MSSISSLNYYLLKDKGTVFMQIKDKDRKRVPSSIRDITTQQQDPGAGV
jgi:hypothetical protein